jgi:hypothetical protein
MQKLHKDIQSHHTSIGISKVKLFNSAVHIVLLTVFQKTMFEDTEGVNAHQLWAFNWPLTIKSGQQGCYITKWSVILRFYLKERNNTGKFLSAIFKAFFAIEFFLRWGLNRKISQKIASRRKNPVIRLRSSYTVPGFITFKENHRKHISVPYHHYRNWSEFKVPKIKTCVKNFQM